MGVDATIPKGESDFSPKPIPGSSDVGGAGVACETDGVRNFSSCGHGSHVAGIVAGFSVTSDPFVGVCPYNCQILPIRAARRCFSPKGRSDGECELASEAPSFNPATMREFNGGIPDSAQLRGLSYVLDLESPTSPGKLATNIVNLSIGRYFSSRSLSLISRRVVQNDILMVAAAGNQNVEVPMFPAAYKDVVAVCATSIDEEFAGGNKEPNGSGDPSQSFPVRGKRLKARFSNFGDWVDICAPGSSILSSKPGANTGTESGTSQASPHVSGVAGMLKAFQPGLSALELRAVLIKYADFDFLYGTLPNGKLANEDFAFSPYPDIKVFLLGSGFLSAGRAYKALFEPSTVQESQASYAIESGDTSQVTSGCVVSSLAAGNKLKPIEVTTSMPISLLFAWLLLHLSGIRRKRPGR
jgi:subtilisin family serine protease